MIRFFTLTWSSLSNFFKLFFTHVISPVSPKKIVYRYFESPLHERDDLSTEEIWKPFYSSSGEHLLQVAEESNQSREEPEIVADEDETRNITAPEALKKFYELKNLIEVNGSDHLNMIFNDLIENVKQMKLKSQKQSDIRSFFRS